METNKVKTKPKTKVKTKVVTKETVVDLEKDIEPTVESLSSVSNDLWKPLDGSTSVLPVRDGVVLSRDGTMVFVPKVRLKKNIKGVWTLV